MARLQDQDLEHQDVVVRRPAALRPVQARNSPLKLGPERLKLHQFVQPLQIVALCQELPKPILDVKEPRLPHHDPLRSRREASESQNRRSRRGFWRCPTLLI
jgi:hypothetical protein